MDRTETYGTVNMGWYLWYTNYSMVNAWVEIDSYFHPSIYHLFHRLKEWTEIDRLKLHEIAMDPFP